MDIMFLCCILYQLYMSLQNSMDVQKIQNIFSIGFRCNTDQFLNTYLNIRKYSSPFSYMVIDIQTALHFIKNDFNTFTDMNFILPGKTSYKFNKHKWICNNIHKISNITNDYVDILDTNNICIWNHHNLSDENTLNSINRRAEHLLYCINKNPEETLLFYIEKIQKYGEKEDYFDKSVLDEVNCKFLILIPILNFNSDPRIHYSDKNVKIIYFNSNIELWATDINSHIEEWDKLKSIINKLYDFDITNRINI